jgi:hypothetical protein
MSNYIETNHVEWCKAQFRMLADGGVWAIPRSGVVFQRRGDELHLHEVMPWSAGMPISAAQLKEQQDGEFEAVRIHFEAAGIQVKR